ncbi:MAG: type II/IV secretion system protein [Candidatus Saganbacteria bacterium]|nr:type II/IV secretion system protein [Candidatus Saganbacteria bacterium]
MRRRDLKDALLESGLLTAEKIQTIIRESKKSGKSLVRVLLMKKYLTEKQLLDFFEFEMDIPHVDLGNYLIDPGVIELVPSNIAKKFGVTPLFKTGSTLSVAMIDPFDIQATDELRSRTRMQIEVMAATPSDIGAALNQYYGISGALEEILETIKDTKKDVVKREIIEVSEDAPVVKLVNLIIIQAMEEKASDIHIDPHEKQVMVRYRVDGIMHEASTSPIHLHAALVTRIKILSNLNIAESRLPQDGKMEFEFEARRIDVRVSTYPSINGESVVMRILDKQAMGMTLKNLGFEKDNLEIFQNTVKRPYGIILLTGPTGSGKTTTLYAALNYINSPENNIITIEDPVEYQLEGIRQANVNVKAGLLFSTALRSMLRQDPDVILVGEIRDLETAQIAIESALTGHLVFSTLHTNDAAGALTRLTEMGVEPFLSASATASVIAQRLVRSICPNCKISYPIEDAVKELYPYFKENNITTLYKGKGCRQCRDRGFRGRLAIIEQLPMSNEIRQMVLEKVPGHLIKAAAIKAGMRTLRDDGLMKVAQGKTSLDEVLRVTQLD